MANTKVTGDLIASSTIATGNIADNAVTSDKISGITTSHIAEGSNLYYTDARADARVALIVDSAPATLDTLNELAAALGDDPNFATTTANSIGLKAPLASPSFTGNATFAGRVNAGESFGALKDGADTVADGPFFRLTNAAATRQYLFQLDASNNIDYWYYNGSGWTQTISLLTDGSATFAGNITAGTINSDNITVGKADGNNSSISLTANTGNWTFTNIQSNRNLEISDSDGTGTVMTIDTSGNVGIGTNSPTSKLSISGSQAAIDITRGNSGDSKWEFSSDSTALYFSEMSTGTRAYMMTIKETTGNVGIGNTVANGFGSDTVLAVYNAATPRIKLQNSTTGTANTDGGELNMSGSDFIIENREAGNIKIFNNGGERMRITSGGDLCVGVTSALGRIHMHNSGTSYFHISNDTTGSGAGSGTDIGIFTGQSDLQINNREAASVIISTSDTPRLTINSSGNLGIGTTSPGYKLQVAGTIGTTNRLAIKETNFGYSSSYKVVQFGESAATKGISLGYDPSGNTSGSFSGNEILIPNNIRILAPAANNSGYYGLMMLNSSNKVLLGASNYLMESNYIMALDTATKRVGIGTDSPVNALHIKAPNGGMMRIENSSGQIGAYTEFSGGYAYQYYYELGGGVKIALQTNGNSYFNGGNVGIGTTTPDGKLEVAGGTTLGLRLSNVGDSSAYDQVRMTYGGYNGGSPTVTFMPLTTPGSGNADTTFHFMNTNGLNASSNNRSNVNIDGVLSVGSGKAVGETTLKMRNYDASLTNSNSIQNSIRMSGRYWTGATSQLVETRINSVHQESNGNGGSALTFWTQTGGDAATEQVRIDKIGQVGIGTTLPTRKLDVAGEITHEGLVPKAGAFVDGLVTINKTVSTTANVWTSLDISLSNIGGTGTFAVQVYSNAHGSTNALWYSMYWSGIMSWYHSTVNATDIDEIPLHCTGHAMNGSTLEIRTKLHIADGSSYANRCELQIKTSRTLTSAPISFRFRKLL